ncbi:hypothetical protein HDU76_012477, partial [Blyttiomyces sp. JEL0837]
GYADSDAPLVFSREFPLDSKFYKGIDMGTNSYNSQDAVLANFNGIDSQKFKSGQLAQTLKTLVYVAIFISRTAAVLGVLASVNLWLLRSGMSYIQSSPNCSVIKYILLALPEQIALGTVNTIQINFVEDLFRQTNYADLTHVKLLLRPLKIEEAKELVKEARKRNKLLFGLRDLSHVPNHLKEPKSLSFFQSVGIFMTNVRMPSRLMAALLMMFLFTYVALVSSLNELQNTIVSQTGGDTFIQRFYNMVVRAAIPGSILSLALLLFNMIDFREFQLKDALCCLSYRLDKKEQLLNVLSKYHYYSGWLLQEHHHSNPVLKVALIVFRNNGINVAQSRLKGAPNLNVEGVDLGSHNNQSDSPRSTCNSIALRRWHLVYTLLRNPQLVKYRKHRVVDTTVREIAAKTELVEREIAVQKLSVRMNSGNRNVKRRLRNFKDEEIANSNTNSGDRNRISAGGGTVGNAGVGLHKVNPNYQQPAVIPADRVFVAPRELRRGYQAVPLVSKPSDGKST